MQRHLGIVWYFGILTLVGASTLRAQAGALPAQAPVAVSSLGAQDRCSIHVTYAHVGTQGDDSLHWSARIQAVVSDVQGRYSGWAARIDVPALGLKATVDGTGHAELLIPWEQLAGKDSVVVGVLGLAHHEQTTTVRVAPGTIATITATLCLMPLDGPMAMQIVTAARDRTRNGCRISLSQLPPSARAPTVGVTAPAIIRGTITDTMGTPLEQATLVLTLFRGGIAMRPGAYTDSHGHALFVITAEQLANVDSMVVYARRIGYQLQRVAARIVPGDTVFVTAALCPPPIVQSEFTDVRVRECRGTDTNAVRLVRMFITEHVEFQAEHHMTPLDPGTVRLLTDARDAALCHRLNAALPTATYVSGGAYYFALMPRTRVPGADGTWFYPEWRSLAVFDRDLTFVGVAGL